MKKMNYVFLCFLLWFGVANSQSRFEYSHQQMGTQIRLVFYAQIQQNPDSIAQLVFNRIDELNGVLSNYLPDSDLTRLSKTSKINVSVHDDLFNILQLSVQYGQKTHGAFDITMGPLIALWKTTRKTKVLPTTEQIQLARKNTGSHNIQFPSRNIVSIQGDSMQLDLGGIGKGYAADEAIKLLQQNGISSAMVDMGGDITVSDPPADKDYWVVGFGYYNKEGKEIVQRIKLKNRAIATSGDLYQYVWVDGKRYSHIIDPKSGMALSNNIQVTTIAPNGSMADAYASAFSVGGQEKAGLIKNGNTAVEFFMVSDVPGNYQQLNSVGFEDFLLK